MSKKLNFPFALGILLIGLFSANISQEELLTHKNIKEYIGLFMAGGKT